MKSKIFTTYNIYIILMCRISMIIALSFFYYGNRGEFWQCGKDKKKKRLWKMKCCRWRGSLGVKGRVSGG